VSEGPIKRERAAWAPPAVTTTSAERICMVAVLSRRTTCGRKPEKTHQATNWDYVTCSDCKAAARADKEARR
jgi:hypothetical protein